jgi:hypothetical protein
MEMPLPKTETFKPGDRVRVIADLSIGFWQPYPDGEYVGETGTVAFVYSEEKGWVEVKLDGGDWNDFHPAELALLPPEPAEEPLFEGELMVSLSDEEKRTLMDLSKRNDLTHRQVMRQALRLYQLVDHKQQEGHQMRFSGDDETPVGCGWVD